MSMGLRGLRDLFMPHPCDECCSADPCLDKLAAARSIRERLMVAGSGIASLAGRAAARSWALLVLALGVAVEAAIFLPLIPASGRGLGHDYQLHFPNLLAGYFFELTNGLLAVPWFSPAECAGVPYLADLNVGYYALPQWLTFAVDPLMAVRATFLVFATLGGLGAYLLLRWRFGASREAALVAALLFLFNTFWPLRMAIGHLTFHPFMLAPWFPLILLPTPDGRGLVSGWAGSIAAAILAGALTAYEFQAGMVHVIIPVAVATTVIMLIHGHLFGHRWRPWIVFAAAILVSVALSASRLVAALGFLHQFPRADYLLPGIASLWTTLRLAVTMLFWSMPTAEVEADVVNKSWAVGRDEIDYSVGPAAAVLLVVGAAVLVFGWYRNGLPRSRLRRAGLVGLAILVLLALPLLVNWYSPGWNAFLKNLPIIGESAVLLRWFAAYIPVVAVVAGLALDRVLPAAWPRRLGLVAAAGVTVAFAIHLDKAEFRHQPYDASLIEASWASVHDARRRAADHLRRAQYRCRRHEAEAGGTAEPAGPRRHADALLSADVRLSAGAFQSWLAASGARASASWAQPAQPQESGLLHLPQGK